MYPTQLYVISAFRAYQFLLESLLSHTMTPYLVRHLRSRRSSSNNPALSKGLIAPSWTSLEVWIYTCLPLPPLPAQPSFVFQARTTANSRVCIIRTYPNLYMCSIHQWKVVDQLLQTSSKHPQTLDSASSILSQLWDSETLPGVDNLSWKMDWISFPEVAHCPNYQDSLVWYSRHWIFRYLWWWIEEAHCVVRVWLIGCDINER